MSLKYACVYDGTKLVSEHPTAQEQPRMSETLQKIIGTVPPKEYRRKTIEDQANGLNYHYLSNGEGKIVGCAATTGIRMRVAFNFLEAVEPLVRATSSSNPQEQKQAKKVIQQKLEFFNNPQNDKITALNREVEDTKAVMLDNMDKVLARGDRVDTLQTKSTELSVQAETFHKQSVAIKRKFCWRNAKLTIMVVLAGVVVLIIILFIACDPNFDKCS